MNTPAHGRRFHAADCGSKIARAALGLLLAVTVFAPATHAIETPTSEPTRQASWAWRELVKLQVENRSTLPSPLLAAVHRGRPYELSPLLLHASPDTEIVTMSPFRVEGARLNAQLKQEFEHRRKQAQEEYVSRQLGIGAHSYTTRRYSATLVTVFYVPVAANVSWKW